VQEARLSRASLGPMREPENGNSTSACRLCVRRRIVVVGRISKTKLSREAQFALLEIPSADTQTHSYLAVATALLYS
jgi:hypothetical protein